MEGFSRVWEGEETRAVVVGFAGIGGHSVDFAAWGAELSLRTITMASRDHPGVGGRTSEPLGELNGMPCEVDAAIAAAHARWPGRPVVAAGESLGALILLAHAGCAPESGPVVSGSASLRPAAAEHEQPDGLVLSAPAIRTPRKISPWGLAVMALRLAIRSGKHFDFTGDPALLTNDPAEREEIERDPLRRRALPASYLFAVRRLQGRALRFARAVRVPTLILWGEEDRLASFPAARKLLSIIPPELRRLEVIAGERHMLTRGARRRETAGLIARWIEQTVICERPAEAGERPAEAG